MQSRRGGGASYIWSGIWEAKEALKKGFRWVLGDVRSINAHCDPWLRGKQDFCVEDYQLNSSRNEKVCNYFRPNTKEWDEERIRQSFQETDVTAFLDIRIPENARVDRLAWTASTDGCYSVKSGYNYWQSASSPVSQVQQSNGWNRLWRLSLPPKVKIFLWRFCKNTIPVRDLLRHKGVSVPTLCPFCNLADEHMVHMFFECSFANQCWRQVNMICDVMNSESASKWLLDKFATDSYENLTKIVVVL